MNLDVNTLHFCSAVSRSAYVIVFVVIILSQRQRSYLWQWMGAMGASMAGSFLMMNVPPDAMPPVPVAAIVYCLYATSLVLSWTGFRSFFGKPVNIGLSALLIAVPGLIYPTARFGGLSHRLSLASVMFACMVLAILALIEIFRGRIGSTRLWSQYIEIAAFGCYALILLLSVGMLIGTDMPVASAESARASMIVDQIVGVFVYFGYVAMAAELANRNLLLIAETDPLTGLQNRRGLREALPNALSRGKGWPSGILMADIDHFKSINDRYGHEGGDLVLAAFANRIRAALRASDQAARWGGEEFLAFLPATGSGELVDVAERLRAAVAAQPFAFADGSVAVTVSIGIATMEPGDHDFEAAVLRADAALYEAKVGGRNRVCFARRVNVSAPPVGGALLAW